MTAPTPDMPADLPRPVFHRLVWPVAGLVAVVAFGLAVFALSLRAELDQAAERGRADLALASDRLAAGLQRYRELAVFLSDHPTVLALSRAGTAESGGAPGGAPGAATVGAAVELMQGMADKTGAQSLMLVARDGRVLAAAGEEQRPRGAQAAHARAMTGALGIAHFVDSRGRRRYVFAAPVFAGGGRAAAAVIVNVDVALIEWGWPSEPSAAFFTDDYGVVFVSNRSELILRGGLAGPMPVEARHRIGGHDIWRLSAGPYIPSPALHLTQPLPVVGLEAELLMDLAPVLSRAGLQGGMAAVVVLLFVMALIFVAERRRALAEANARLEARVAARTEALEVANRELLREVHEREEAEARLKRAQADLVQAGKLSALGEMSAGISHELNQPLMAIRSFAENARTFLDRDRPDRAADNLERISELARRMGRIIKNLRAFARQEPETITDVELTSVVEAALEMTQAKIANAGVTLDWAPAGPVWVRGGEVRLQQVVMNLLSNAVDAMRESPEKRLGIRIEPGDPTRLRVSDTGGGIAEPEKIFDPFYTTKPVGASEGMGLGLSISYGLIQSFGGRIRGANRAGGGAEFTIELTPARVTTPGEAAE
ncbi:ATP-binding protein [Celeribacter indicus]|uniref:C4-dicarboxylate transport sensor protein DctB n=1 Tax=Celeribacter indicus TaxID=1208324 RepID=A0A0B5DS08_9RHOB|nr:ATP-binding protein [Celeribacter indicus]AJE46308.1 C4-dicarboxylate transport sensor protein [Celeribacter indicus]SDW52926.1 two-component system, NtrC family, C4-dicarboxylate transport sensor histidine kinase DctB [Celeribacter indicus]